MLTGKKPGIQLGHCMEEVPMNGEVLGRRDQPDKGAMGYKSKCGCLGML